MAVPTGNAAKVVTFKGFKRCFVAGVALRHIRFKSRSV